MNLWENIKGPSLGAIFFTVYHIFVANIVFKWRNNGILMRPKHLFITIEMSKFIYTTLYNDQCSIYCSQASFLTLFSVMKISYIFGIFSAELPSAPLILVPECFAKKITEIHWLVRSRDFNAQRSARGHVSVVSKQSYRRCLALGGTYIKR